MYSSVCLISKVEISIIKLDFKPDYNCYTKFIYVIKSPDFLTEIVTMLS